TSVASLSDLSPAVQMYCPSRSLHRSIRVGGPKIFSTSRIGMSFFTFRKFTRVNSGFSAAGGLPGAVVGLTPSVGPAAAAARSPERRLHPATRSAAARNTLSAMNRMLSPSVCPHDFQRLRVLTSHPSLDGGLEFAAELADRGLHRPAGAVSQPANRRSRHDPNSVADINQ